MELTTRPTAYQLESLPLLPESKLDESLDEEESLHEESLPEDDDESSLLPEDEPHEESLPEDEREGSGSEYEGRS